MNIFQSFIAINQNAFYAIWHFITSNIMFLLVLASIVYHAYIELKDVNDSYVYDDRNII